MKRPNYNILITTTDTKSRSRIRFVQIRPLVLLLCGCFLLISTIGFSRLIGFVALYGQATIGYYKESVANERLRQKIDFLDESVFNEKKKLNDLVTFEDKTRLTFGMDPISSDVRRVGIGGALPHSGSWESGNMADSNPLFLKTVAVKESVAVLVRKVELQKATFEQMGKQVEDLYKFWAQRPSIWPATGRITSGFGLRMHPILGESLFHDGIDIANDIGTPIYAPAEGIVKETGNRQNYGRAVNIEHPECGIETIYGHMHNYMVRAGEKVSRGDLIGYIGNSGNSTGPHLHYEIRRNGRPINPSAFILPSDEMID